MGRTFEETKEQTCTMIALCCSNFATFDSSMDFDQEAEIVPANRPSTQIGPWYRGTNAPSEELKEATWRQWTGLIDQALIHSRSPSDERGGESY